MHILLFFVGVILAAIARQKSDPTSSKQLKSQTKKVKDGYEKVTKVITDRRTEQQKITQLKSKVDEVTPYVNLKGGYAPKLSTSDKAAYATLSSSLKQKQQSFEASKGQYSETLTKLQKQVSADISKQYKLAGSDYNAVLKAANSKTPADIKQETKETYDKLVGLIKTTRPALKSAEKTIADLRSQISIIQKTGNGFGFQTELTRSAIGTLGGKLEVAKSDYSVDKARYEKELKALQQQVQKGITQMNKPSF